MTKRTILAEHCKERPQPTRPPCCRSYIRYGRSHHLMYRSTSPILIMLLFRSFQCGVGNSNILEKDMMPGKSLLGSYEVVKAAFERCYDKLGISCQDVGGLIDHSKKQYKKGAEACGGVMPGMSNRPLISLCFSGRFNLCILKRWRRSFKTRQMFYDCTRRSVLVFIQLLKRQWCVSKSIKRRRKT